MEMAISNMKLSMVQQSASVSILGKAMDLSSQTAAALIQDMAVTQPQSAAFVRPGGMDIRV